MPREHWRFGGCEASPLGLTLATKDARQTSASMARAVFDDAVKLADVADEVCRYNALCQPHQETTREEAARAQAMKRLKSVLDEFARRKSGLESPEDEARRFVAFLRSDSGRKVLCEVLQEQARASQLEWRL